MIIILAPSIQGTKNGDRKRECKGGAAMTLSLPGGVKAEGRPGPPGRCEPSKNELEEILRRQQLAELFLLPKNRCSPTCGSGT